MKKLLLIIGFTFMLASCSQDEQIKLGDVEDESMPANEIDKTEVVKMLNTQSKMLHFVADWLSDKEIVYVSRENDLYNVKIFNIATGEHKVVYEDSAIIVGVFVHTSRKALLLHTTNSPTSAQVKVIGLDGTHLNEVSIASSEINIEWNDIDPALILITAFEEDWTYEIYIYNGEENKLKSISLSDPFPKWLGVGQIVYFDQAERSPEGGELLLFNPETGGVESTGMLTVTNFDTFKESLLTVQLADDLSNDYTIINSDKELLSTWSRPADDNYFEGVFPEIHWKSNQSILMTFAEKLDNSEKSFKLYEVADGNQKVLIEDLPANTLRCSPDGSKCFTGYSYEEIIDMESKKTVEWILLQ